MKAIISRLLKAILGTIGLSLSFNTAFAQTHILQQHPLLWITLGTQGGPAPTALRSEPSNILVVGNNPWIVDCGDGVMERFAAAGFVPPQANTVFISHLHVDHIGGLQGIIALHWFRGRTGSTPVIVYGPPGTDKLVAGIIQSLQPTADIAKVEQAGKWSPAESVKVIILKGGADFTLDGVRVRAARNSHFDNPPGHHQENGTQSLSYRFDCQGYAIGYTGDTGPSDSVATLMHQVNLLFCEVTQRRASSIEGAIPSQRVGRGGQDSERYQAQAGTGGPSQQQGGFHFEYQHLNQESAAKLAATAGVQHLVFTHLAIPQPTDSVASRLIEGAEKFFKGEVTVAHDLERF